MKETKIERFVKDKYPDAWSFRNLYNNRLRRNTWCILKAGTMFIMYDNPQGSDTEAQAWRYAKEQIEQGVLPNYLQSIS